MKKIASTVFSVTLVLMCNFSMAQDKPATQKSFINGADTRVDNMAYWMDKAHKGLVPYNAEIPVNQAEYKSSKINVPGVKTTDSPDIPVTSLTNVTESGNSVFVDPNNANYILNSNNSTSWSGGTIGTLYGANYFQSANGGLNWGGSEQGAGGNNWGNPTTAIGLNGRQYINFLTDPGGQGIAYSDDGLSWYTAAVASSSYGTDKNHMWIDNSPTSPYYGGRLYVAFTSFSGYYANQIVRSYSTDNGLTWSAPYSISSAVSAGSHNQGANIQTGPNGEFYVTWAIYDDWPSDETAIGFTKSTDGGSVFTSATRIIGNIRGIRATKTSKNHRVNSYPSMACDISGGPNNGNLYIVWANMGTPGVNTGSNISVYMIRSTNGGINWSTPVRVNQNPFEEGKEAYFPWICCDPETGVLTAVFYDDRNTLSSSCEVFSAYSLDAGNTWVDFRVSDVSFSPSPIPGLAAGYMGDYLGITSKGGKVYPCWTDNRSGYMTYVSPYELGLNAGFAADDTKICTGSSVTFTDFSTVYPISWAWSFPGGIPASYNGQNPPPVYYITSGEYDVSLTVSDGIDNDTETKTNYITVKNIVADFSGTPQTVVTGNTVSFTYLSCGSPTSWLWAFPGGTPSSYSGAIPPAITYNTAGTYNVSLTLTGPGISDTETKTDYINVINCTYCATSYSNTSNEWISNVTFNTINSSSGSTIYSDFTSLSTDVNPDSSYNISVGITTNSTYTEHCIVFIDWNQDCDFNDAGESYDLGQTYGSGGLNSIINVPTDAQIGSTRMRVSMRESTNPNGCDVTTRGEAEDYTVYVLDGIGLELTVMIEGPFSGTNMDANIVTELPLSQPYNIAPWNYNGVGSVATIPNNDIVDWMLIELRETPGAASSATSATSIAMKEVFLLKDGHIVDLDGVSLPKINFYVSENLYLVLWHRNHLSVMSSIPLVETMGKYTYDFTDQLSKVYLEGQKEIDDGIYGMIAGDIDGSGIIDADDKNNNWNIVAGEMGYDLADINLDGEINNIDKDDFWNLNVGRETKVPSGISFNCGSILIDDRDGQSYNTLQIGTRCWMAENLNIGTIINGSIDQTNDGIIEKYCFNNSTANCDIYGGLYSWNEMMQYTTTPGVQGICPDNWNIPTDAEWTVLTDFLGGESIAGGKMKTTGTIENGTGLWFGPNTGATNSSGFTASPGGARGSSGGTFYTIGQRATFWTSTENGTDYAWSQRVFYNNANADRNYYLNIFSFSVRCMRY